MGRCQSGGGGRRRRRRRREGPARASSDAALARLRRRGGSGARRWGRAGTGRGRRLGRRWLEVEDERESLDFDPTVKKSSEESFSFTQVTYLTLLNALAVLLPNRKKKYLCSRNHTALVSRLLFFPWLCLDPWKSGRKSHIGHCSTFRLFVVNIVLS